MHKKKSIPVIYPDAPIVKFGLTSIETDPLGSYTGVPNELDEVPVQDADDL